MEHKELNQTPLVSDGSARRPFRWCLGVLLGLFLLLLAQFILFRQESIYGLNLRSHLLDHVWWVEQEADHLILGSSDAMNSVIPQRVMAENPSNHRSVLNLGMNGCTPFGMMRNLNLYLQRFSSPKRVDITITPALLQEGYYVRCDYEKIWLSWKQWWSLQDEGVSNSYFFPSMMFWESLKFRRRYLFREYHFDLRQTRAMLGFQPNYEAPQRAYHLHERDLPKITTLFPWSLRQILILKQMADRVKALGGRVNFLVTPLHPILYDAMLKESAMDDLEMILNEHLGDDASVLGDISPHAYGLDARHFINGDHLTYEGARRFTSAVYGPRGEKRSGFSGLFFDPRP
jgi:hypothetical protein